MNRSYPLHGRNAYTSEVQRVPDDAHSLSGKGREGKERKTSQWRRSSLSPRPQLGSHDWKAPETKEGRSGSCVVFPVGEGWRDDCLWEKFSSIYSLLEARKCDLLSQRKPTVLAVLESRRPR